MVLELDAVPDQVKMPGGQFMPSVADASDEQLADQLQVSLDVIADQLAKWSVKPDRDGYCPATWWDHAATERPMHSAESATRRNERLARAIRKEQIGRRERAAAALSAEIADARDRLGQILKDTPGEAQRAVDTATEVVAAAERVRSFVSDLRLMAGGVGIASHIESLHRGAATAADALGQPRPDLPDAPDGLPTRGDVQQVLAAFIGRGGFDTVFRPETEAAKASELARKLG